MQASRWENLVWPRWLPTRARLPLVAQILCTVALTVVITDPWWSRLKLLPAVPHAVALPAAPAVVPVRPVVPTPSPSVAVRPAHLNLDVRHSFGSVDVSIAVDGKPAFATILEGSGKRFKMFGKRSARGFTKTLDLVPGVRVVRVRVRSAADKFDQTRVARFDLASAAVAGLRVAADKTGLTLVAERPPVSQASAVWYSRTVSPSARTSK